MKRILAIVLALVMVSSVVLCTSAETTPLTYVGENGYTATKISLPESGVGEVDGLVGDRSQNYAWSSVGYGDYVYVGTSFGVVYTALKVIANAKGMDFAQLKLIIDCLYNGKLYTGDEGEVNTPPRSLIAKINTKTYETEIIESYAGVVGFRAATKLNDKLYFAAATPNQPYILEVDPENGDATNIVCYSEKTTDPSVSTGIRGLTTYRDMLVATLITDNGAYMVASNNPSAGQDAFEVVCTQEDLLDYPAYHYMDSIFGGSIWDIVEYNDKLYMSVVTGKNGSKQPFALFSGEVDENGEWTFDLVVGNEADGAEYPFGLGSPRSGAANLAVHDGYLYIGGFNDPMIALPTILKGSFEDLYKDLSSPVCLWRLDADNNIEMVAGEANEVFPEGPIGNMGAGFGSNMNQYVWRMISHNGKLYVGTFDVTGLVRPLAQFTNGDILKMTKEEWDSQIDYIRQVIDQFGLMPESDKDIAATGASLEIAALAEDLDTLEALSEDFDNADVTLEYRQKFYDALLKVKEQYLTVRDYLSTEAKERIDAFFADERVKNLGYFVGSLYYMSKSEEGYDLFVSNDGVNFDVITRDGMGDPYNYGSRVFAITNSGLCIGTANPFYGAQVWLLDEDLMMGDVNMDGEVNIFDATEIQFNIAGMVELTDDQMYVADVNYDGEVNIFDVTTIQEFIAGYITEF